ncbi:alpha-L-glutamate ligase [Streptomyces sp. NPDC052292]|uniref:ATP-grasp domain-containing protein n=1 Tax=Streptomyces sp. NPDC052292 TaxID=3155053 RepID=UPI0034415110
MRIGLITSDPGHPLLAATTALLADEHTVLTLDPRTAPAPEPSEPVADVYLLKARTPQAISLARALEERGARVVNSAAATELCQDRTVMAEHARRAGLPFAATRTYPTLARLVEGPGFRGPLVVKSRHSRKHDLVARVDDDAGLRPLAAAHPHEPVVVQQFAPNDGWDRKLWAIGGRIFAALRRSELSPEGRGPTLPLALDSLPPGWASLVRQAGEVFALDVYGVDILDRGPDGPLIVDVNAFPGVRAQPGAPQALAALALSNAGARHM